MASVSPGVRAEALHSLQAPVLRADLVALCPRKGTLRQVLSEDLAQEKSHSWSGTLAAYLPTVEVSGRGDYPWEKLSVSKLLSGACEGKVKVPPFLQNAESALGKVGDVDPTDMSFPLLKLSGQWIPLWLVS